MARKEYLQDIQSDYLKALKQEKGRLLDEAMKRTGLTRKYITRKLAARTEWAPTQRKARRVMYDGLVRAALVRVWEIFDYPCGQRLAPLLPEMVPHLRALKELRISDAVADKLTQIKSAQIDRLLRHEKRVRHLSRTRNPGVSRLLYHRIPVKLSTEWDRNQLGNLQLDYVAHCGSSLQGHFAYTLSGADIGSGWWDGEAFLGRSQEATYQGLKHIKSRLPFAIKEIHPDNDTGLINELIYGWCSEQGIAISRSRPCKKNDNAWVEQRNWTHVRKVVGYLRYDTFEEVLLLNLLYRSFCLYRNFCLPTMKLVSKERVGGHIKRTYDKPTTPYQRILASGQLTAHTQSQLKKTYTSLNPAALKRRIEEYKLALLKLYEQKPGKLQALSGKKTYPRMVTNYMMQPVPVRLPSYMI
ncbi:MAG: hypothetical protein V1895_00425 [Parcubacteria group bacterium]